MSIHRVHPFLVIAAAAVLAFTASASLAADEPKPAKPWDQAAVTGIAGQLAKACNELYDEYYKTPGSSGKPTGTGQAKESYRLKHDLRRIQASTKQLAGALASGEGRDETQPQVEDIGLLARDVRVQISRMFIQSPLQARIDTANGLWRQLMPYYGLTPPPEKP